MTARVKQLLLEKRKTVWLCAALLLVLIAATAAALVSAFLHSAENADLSIELFSGKPHTMNLRELNAEQQTYRPELLVMRSVEQQAQLLANEPYTVEDSTQVWGTDTRVDIFSLEYRNGEFLAAASGNGERIIAPGTANSYSFELRNNSNGYADYQLTVEAEVSGMPKGKTLPVEVRFRSPGGFLRGSEDDSETSEVNEEVWEPVSALNGIQDSHTLDSFFSSRYTLEWRWPFESGDDELDTQLGNLSAAGEPVTLTIRIMTSANYHWPENPVITPIPQKLNGENHNAYIFGYPDGTIRPLAAVTRAEVASIFYRVLKDNVREKYYSESCDFSDVADGEWYTEEIATLTKMGILSGYPDGSFRPDEAITRAEFAVVCERFMETVPHYRKSNLTDIKGHWAEKSILRCEQAGWMIGDGHGLFRPNDSITRAETVSVVNRMLHRMPEQLSDLHKDMYRWPDNADENAWYYIAIQEASVSHSYQRGTGTREFWTGCLKAAKKI